VWKWHNVALFWLKKPQSDASARATAAVLCRCENHVLVLLNPVPVTVLRTVAQVVTECLCR
jgi:hypothetical protein